MIRLRTAAVAVAAGLLLAASLPPWGWWPLAFGGLVLVDRLLADQPLRARLRRGCLVGVALLAPSLWWMQDLTVPGYGIAVVVYAVVLGGALALCPPGRWRWLALPGAWMLAEAVRASWPFGGVPLSTLALGQVAGPLAPVARVGGWLLLSGVTVAVAVALAAALARRWSAAGAAAAVVAGAMALAAIAPSGEDTGQTISVAVVQGGGPQGTRAIDTDERVVFERHLEASAAVEPGTDLTLWPEDVVDVESDVTAVVEGSELADLARRLDTVLVVGAVEEIDDEHFRNRSIAFGPDGEVIDDYLKVHRVPFGEYVPMRPIIEPFAGEALTDRDAVIGRGEPVLDLPVGRLGVAISWEVFFADRGRASAGAGGEILLNPTNGSSYRGTLVQTQQIASSQLRAIESGRWVVQAAPTGFSAFITPSGEVLERTGVSEQAVRTHVVARRTGETWFVRWGQAPVYALAVVLVAVAWLRQPRRRRRAGGSDLEQQRDRAVVDEGDLHLGAEAPGGHRGAPSP